MQRVIFAIFPNKANPLRFSKIIVNLQLSSDTTQVFIDLNPELWYYRKDKEFITHWFINWFSAPVFWEDNLYVCCFRRNRKFLPFKLAIL